MKAMKQVVPGENLPMEFLTNGTGFQIEDHTGTIPPPLPFYRTSTGDCVIRWQLSWRQRIKIALSGNLWHFVRLASQGSLQPFRIYAECPLSVSHETEQRIEEGPVVPRVYMSGRGMLDDIGFCETGFLKMVNGFYEISGYEKLGRFETQNAALDALAKVLRKKNKGKWWER